MAGQGRGSAMVAMVLLFMLICQFEMGSAATYTVGDAGGWTFNVASWPNGKHFRAGDILGKSILFPFLLFSHQHLFYFQFF